LRLWLWLIARLTSVATLVCLLRLLRVVTPLTGRRTRRRIILLLWLAVIIFAGHGQNVRGGKRGGKKGSDGAKADL